MFLRSVRTSHAYIFQDTHVEMKVSQAYNRGVEKLATPLTSIVS